MLLGGKAYKAGMPCDQFEAEFDFKTEPQFRLGVSYITHPFFTLLTSTILSDPTNMQSPRHITKSEIDAFAPPPRQKYMMKVSEPT